MSKRQVTVFWFRRDLRLTDNKALHYAIKSEYPVLPLFIFDTEILSELDESDNRVAFIYREISQIKEELKLMGSDLLIKTGRPAVIFEQLIDEYDIKEVYCNKDHEPYGIDRDKIIKKQLLAKGIKFIECLDHLIMDKESVLKADGNPYTVFTPYKNKFKQVLVKSMLLEYPTEGIQEKVMKSIESDELITLKQLGFQSHLNSFPSKHINQNRICNYDKYRDSPSIEGTSRLGVHLRFGTISIRELFRVAKDLNEVYYNELIWREFFAMIMQYYPAVVTSSFKSKYDNIDWINNNDDFEAWKSGNTGYPLVDAGMRELNATGFMHNRLRMLTASFLCKHLLIDWRWGEAYFAEKLLDYELSSNNGGWQWCAGSGSDAAPYFRVFSPDRQRQRFDPDDVYIKKWVPEFESNDYASPIVEHKYALNRCKKVYGKALY